MNQENYIKDLSEIRSMMEESSRFISLSGLSGVFAGIYAIAGGLIGTYLVRGNFEFYRFLSAVELTYADRTLPVAEIILVFLSVFVLAVGTGILFTTRKAKQQGLRTWDHTSRRLLINLAIPLVTGGVFIIQIMNAQALELVAPATLIFYGLALVNASKYTMRDIRMLGLTEIVVGLISAMVPGYGLLFWMIGFGLLHMLYGTMMYLKYER